mgnify:CR=1 FL=1
MEIFSGEKLGLDCGIDEAGRGAWAGPVVAAAVILPKNFSTKQINDSKKLSKNARNLLFNKITLNSDFGIGYGSVTEIDNQNILQATFFAMRRAVANLKSKPKRVLIDGNQIPPDLPYVAQSVVKGDTKVASIAAASIIAKVTRDRLMKDLARLYPGFGWDRNVGYGVKEHREALKTLGVTPEHRCSFKPIYNMLC